MDRNKLRRIAVRIRGELLKQLPCHAAAAWFIRLCAVRFMEANGWIADGMTDSGAFFSVCKQFRTILPEVFSEQLPLLPDTAFQIAAEQLRSEIPDTEWVGQVQLAGWLYQYFQSVEKDKIFSNLKKNIKVSKEELPAATQLFTPAWIVQYMVENSLGKLWLDGHPDSPLRQQWRFYLPEPRQTEQVTTALDSLYQKSAALTPEKIRCIDPCMGSGHILCYLFDVLMQIYLDSGWPPDKAAVSILRKNLFGLDIDKNAAALSSFAVMMKARQYNAELFSRNLRPHILYFHSLSEGETDAAQFGSLLKGTESCFQFSPQNAELVQLLTSAYDVVVTNPPYMGSSNMNAVLSEYIRDAYPDSKADLFAAFMERCRQFTRPDGYYSMITMQSWMFLLSFRKLREKLMHQDLINLAHFGSCAFDQADVGTIVQTAAFTFRCASTNGYISRFVGLSQYSDGNKKQTAFFQQENWYDIDAGIFHKISASPWVYWITRQDIALFECPRLGEIAETRQGMTTSDNKRFLRRWFEVPPSSICFEAASREEAASSRKKWFPYNKGGGFRKWYGNAELVVNYANDGEEMRLFHAQLNKTSAGGRIKNQEYYFRESLSWSFIALTPGFRYSPKGAIFDVASSSLFPQPDKMLYTLGFLCSKPAEHLLHILNPTMNIQTNDVRSLPFLFDADSKERVEVLAKENIALCKADWNSFETNFSFQKHPLLRGVGRIADAYAEWETETIQRYEKLKANEEELNRIFIRIYHLSDILTPDVKEKHITVRKAELQRDVRSLISYGIGCITGRYPSEFPVKQGVLPVFSSDSYGADLVSWFEDWVCIAYGKQHLEENLAFLASALGTGSDSRSILRKYLLHDFFADHCRVYQKCPVYWLLDSGSAGGCKAIVYVHTMTTGMFSEFSENTVQMLIHRCEEHLQQLEESLLQPGSRSERTKQKNQKKRCLAILEELKGFQKRLYEITALPLNPDDGIRKNYAKLQSVLAKL